MEKKRYDAVVIGAGVTGSAIARELSRYQAEICVLDRHLKGKQRHRARRF